MSMLPFFKKRADKMFLYVICFQIFSLTYCFYKIIAFVPLFSFKVPFDPDPENL